MVNKRRQGDPVVNDSDSTSEENYKSEQNESGQKCTHIKRAVDVQRLRRTFKKSTIENEKCVECSKMSNGDADSGDFEHDITLWMCLQCGSHLCGRLVNKHALVHFKVGVKMKYFSFHSCSNKKQKQMF